MPAAPIPRDEASRKRTLDALNVLDTLPEAFSDAVSTAAAAIANVPISAISLVDTERQWFKGSCGLDVRQTPRDVSFCAYAILDSEPFLVPDALADPRFRDNPLVTGAPHIRSYAGFPIVVAGQAIGSLCVIDDRPRRLAADQIDRLAKLAAGTAAWLAERQTLTGSLNRSEAELRYVTLNDTVTGLPNRVMLQDRLKQAAMRCDRTKARLAVLLVDIDGFKRVNARWSDTFGDAVLREIGQRLTALAASSDIVARIGDDQFVVMTESPDSVESVARLASRIGGDLAAPIGEREQACATASIGICLYPTDGPLERLVANAETAMATAKRGGGNSYCFYEARLDVEARARVELLEQLRFAVQRGELELYYQPKIHARSGQVTGAEALLRWHRPGQGMVSPSVFVPLAERAGLINEIGSWVVAEACRQMQVWHDLGIRMRVAVNLSVHQLRQASLADDIAAELQKSAIEPGLLTCEITESVAMDDATAALDVFRRLTSVGVQLSIDDFGTGYSSLSYLRKLSVHQLKIDRSFVTDLGVDDDARAVAAAIVDLAHALRLEVVAEGVETAEQRDILLELGCDQFQGFLFGKPMTADAFTDWALDRADRRQEFRPSLFAAAQV